MIFKGNFALNRWWVLLLLPLLMASCQYGDDFKTFHYNTAEGEWSIDYPPYMRRSSYVYPGAEFQASNNYRNTSAFVRQLFTSKSAEVMQDSLSAELIGALQDPRIEMDSTYTVNGTTFHTMKFTGLLRDKRVYYLLSVIENNYQLFHFTGWMFVHKRELWENDFDEMLKTWRR